MAFDIPGLTFLKAHENLLITVIVCIALLWGVSKGLSAWQAHDQMQLNQLEKQVADDKTQLVQASQNVAEVKAQATADKAASAQMVAAMAAQNTALNTAIQNRDKQTQTQQQTDLHASIPALSQRFMTLVPGINPADMKVAPDAKTVTIGQDTAEKTVAQLELVPQLTQDNKDLQTEIKNMQGELASVQGYNTVLEGVVAAEDKQVALLEKAATDSDKACDARVEVEKVKGKRSFFRGLKIGVVVGFLGGLFAGHSL